MLHFVRSLIALRRTSSDLAFGGYRALDSPAGSWCWNRGERTVVCLTLTDSACSFEDLTGTVLLCSDRTRDGEVLDGGLRLGGWQAAVLERHRG